MNRRGFLGLLAGAAVAPQLLVPERTIILPPRGGWPVDLRFKATERFSHGWIDARYIHRTYGIGFSILEGDSGELKYHSHADRPDLAAPYREELLRGLQEVFDG